MIPARLRRFHRSANLKRITTGSFDWVYDEFGSGPPLLLIHGLSGSIDWWGRNIPALSQRFTVYAVELRGFAGNRSGRPLPLHASAHGLAAFMETLAIDQAPVVGHSMGAQICLHLASSHPQRVSRLVLAAPSALLRRGLLTMGLRLARAYRYGRVDMFPTVLRDALRAGPVNLVLAARELLKDDVTEIVTSIVAPTLVIAGERDVIVPPEVCELLVRSIRGAHFTILPKAGHNLMWDRPEEFNEAVLAFLDNDQTPIVGSAEGALVGQQEQEAGATNHVS